MPFSEPLVALLKADATIASYTTRVRPVTASQQDSLPYVTYRTETVSHLVSHGGASGLASGLISFTAWSDRYDIAWIIADRIRAMLNGYSGTSGTTEYGSIVARGLNDSPDPEIDGGPANTFGVQCVLSVWYKESVD